MNSDILIYRDFQIIAGFVQVPPNAETDKNRVTVNEALSAISGSVDTQLSRGSGHEVNKIGAQEFLRLPGLVPGTSYGTDPVTALAQS